MSEAHRMSPSRQRSLALAAGVIALACSNPTGSPPVGFCAAVYTPAVTVVAIDSVTGAPLAGLAHGIFRVDTLADSLYHGAAALDSVLYGGPVAGTYRVTVSRAGYQDWTRANIVVTASGVCNELNTADLRARLQPAS